MLVEVRNGPESDFSAAACFVAGVDLMPCGEAKRRQVVTRTRKAHSGAYMAEIEAMK
jgi:hypothetical protein